MNSVFPIWSTVRAETAEELCLKQHNCVIIMMNCPRGLHSKEREIGNTCSQPLEIGFFYYVSYKES